MKTEDLKGCIKVARALGWSGMAEEADDELTQIEGAADATWNAAIEAASSEVVAMLGDRFNAVQRTRVRSLKRGQP